MVRDQRCDNHPNHLLSEICFLRLHSKYQNVIRGRSGDSWSVERGRSGGSWSVGRGGSEGSWSAGRGESGGSWSVGRGCSWLGEVCGSAHGGGSMDKVAPGLRVGFVAYGPWEHGSGSW